MDNDKEQSLQHPIWPAVIQYSGDAELLYINSLAQWNNDASLHSFNYDDADCLIDSAGNTFSLTRKVNNLAQPELLNNPKPLKEILGLVKGHASQLGSCCVSKLYAPSIREAFKIVQSLTET